MSFGQDNIVHYVPETRNAKEGELVQSVFTFYVYPVLYVSDKGVVVKEFNHHDNTVTLIELTHDEYYVLEMKVKQFDAY